jgi:hypothetical protein
VVALNVVTQSDILLNAIEYNYAEGCYSECLYSEFLIKCLLA